MEKLHVVKIGGKVVDNEGSLESFLKSFVKVKGKKVLIHGGGKIATQVGLKLGVPPRMEKGRRITDRDTLEVVTMVYGGLVNRRIVAMLQGMGESAIGLTGADANLIQAKMRPKHPVDFGYVGDIEKESINVDMVQKILDLNLTLVLPALTHDGMGNLLNTNADTIAATFAIAMAEHFDVSLNFCFEENGVLSDYYKKTVVSKLDRPLYEQYEKDGVVFTGMLPKLQNAFNAKESGVKEVKIGHFQNLEDLMNDNQQGTTII
ncbi:acetylglutamate kinase [Roseivirga pacifica]|uniref:acetylglutamate kinase n=1 Tax=Roseivirga pacifica TaxID=1267423 RepID=UPI0020952EF9|nr:acetylglutamate kinase [Roseivirga pacifica]MCO6358721.1 acetylglutamate kinase [Roseivirga pacifica]MCO6365643.1 acetylglutamate kinase [Roseivirga pacifica]MCO6371627.1 acetylglutamate kinase [Roseivirga pacifica]MCO6376262.1 acetylglutamate kinase [Roseivirga pacifica]MCO6379005.1 acetylglutamate kinase [Roseivirga pacifica]